MKLTLDSLRFSEQRARLELKLGQDGRGTLTVKLYGQPTAYQMPLEAVVAYIVGAKAPVLAAQGRTS